ncbi:MalM family protein [Photobacterium sp. J15]|uniref:MalM family protein n=1 Tax=Photobacterium sp. J15 TaxID=265901 RepID=UPI0007E4173A|nr:MalM family protein [Photobacterium sp. J15]
MKIIKTTLAAMLAASLIGCAASPTSGNNSPVKDVAITAQACCTTYSEFSWVPMQGSEIDFVVDEYSKVGMFPEGKSYFATFVLPQNVERMQVDLKSWMKSSGVFAPKVMLLDPQFQPVETISLEDFDVAPSNLFSLSSYQKRFTMEQSKTPYMVVYSPFEYREGQIQIPHPERVRAEELGLARPMVTDPVIQHQKFGSLTLDLKPLNLRSYRADQVVQTPVSKPAPVVAAPVVAAKPAPQAAPAVISAKMLPETEAFYNAQIKAAVEKNDMQKALRLLEEAKRAGSATAESTFINLIKK